MVNNIVQQKNHMQEKMDNSINSLNKEFSGLRTGRASVNLLDPVRVDVYGSKMPLLQVSTISTPDARTISVQVWDKAMVKSIEKAIVEANLGLNPSAEGQNIRISIPPLSEDRRKDLVKIASKYSENSKISIRNIRRDTMDFMKNMQKDKNISEDDYYKESEEIQKITLHTTSTITH
ncbi:MAG TPA: ribosome recycling factor, partial [Candidatus Megaira endosymbiont of Hartmannula sinica]|nr:ribosome recycling factor [Candidatus Megaera endosymbiont of Hartmannula sinica]